MKKILGNGAFCIIWTIGKDGQISVLLQRGPNRNFFELSGGGLEYHTHGEYPEDEGCIFECALIREVAEELGLNLNRTQIEFEAALQQIKIVDEDTRTTGCVFLYSCFLSEDDVNNIQLDRLVLQPEEVEEVRWWGIEKAITTTQTQGSDYVGLSFRRMLVIFYYRYFYIRKPQGLEEYHKHPYQGNLGQALLFREQGSKTLPVMV